MINLEGLCLSVSDFGRETCIAPANHSTDHDWVDTIDLNNGSITRKDQPMAHEPENPRPQFALTRGSLLRMQVVAIEALDFRNGNLNRPASVRLLLRDQAIGLELSGSFTIDPNDRCPQIGDGIEVTVHLSTADWNAQRGQFTDTPPL